MERTRSIMAELCTGGEGGVQRNRPEYAAVKRMQAPKVCVCAMRWAGGTHGVLQCGAPVWG